MNLGFWNGIKLKSFGAETFNPNIYIHSIVSLLGSSSILAYWLMDETTGTVFKDAVNGRNAAESGATLGAVASPVSGKAPTVSSADINAYTAGLGSAINFQDGTLLWWGKTPNWADGNNTIAVYFGTDASNRIYAQKTTTGIMQMRYTGSGSAKLAALPIQTGTAWMHFAMKWSKSNDRLNAFINGYKPVATTTGLGNLTGALASNAALIGELVPGTWRWSGNLAHVILMNREATDAEILAVSRLATQRFSILSILGDSISANMWDWPYIVAPGYNAGATYLTDHAVNGQNIASNLAAQSTSAAGDGATRIIITLGTNDDNSGNMTTLQATAEAGIASLKASNPSATIYWLNVLPRWTDVGGGTPVDKANIRTAIAAACTSQGITCWDTFTTPWITVSDTSDGVHPNATGAGKIATQVLSRLP